MQKKDPAAAQAETEGGKIVYKDPAEEELAKKKARAARFGMPLNLSEDKKAVMRAQRYDAAVWSCKYLIFPTCSCSSYMFCP